MTKRTPISWKLPVAVGLALVLAPVTDAFAQHHPGMGPPPPAQTAATPAEGRRADIAVFRDQFLARDHAYSAAARAEAETRLAALEAQADTVSEVYFELEIAHIVALADNGHTFFFPGPRLARYNRAPVRLTPFGEDFYVLRAKADNAALLGARLVAIDGHPIAELRTAARALQGGTNAWRDRNAALLFESPEELHALYLSRRADRANYRFALPNGRMVNRRLTAEPPSPGRLSGNSEAWLFTAQNADEVAAGWRAALAPANTPWALQEPDDPFRWRAAPELDGLVMQLRQNNDGEHQTVAEAIAELQGAIAQTHPRNLVLDMRFNGGGNLQTTRDFMKSLPDLAPGRIFVLTSPLTFSAGISSVGYLKQAAPDRVSIVGENVGDRLNFFAEGGIVVLPNAQSMMLFATQRHDYATGCASFDDCHGPVRRFPIALATLAPDIPAPWTIEAYRAGRDPGMEAIAAALR